MTPLAWRANEPLVASAYRPAPAAGRITQRDPKLPLRTPLPFAASATSSRRSARSITCSENLWTSAISLTPFSMSTVAATLPRQKRLKPAPLRARPGRTGSVLGVRLAARPPAGEFDPPTTRPAQTYPAHAPLRISVQHALPVAAPV